jgi:PPOX class probable F420-dependent enzyme
MDIVMPDPSTPFGARVARRLREEHVIWLTTVDASGAPQPTPVWFLWDGDTVLIYNRNDARRIAHVQRNPRVALHFDGDKRGGDIVVITGTAQLTPEDPPADQLPVYVDKYRDHLRRLNYTPESFAAAYSVAMRVRPRKIRGH